MAAADASRRVAATPPRTQFTLKQFHDSIRIEQQSICAAMNDIKSVTVPANPKLNSIAEAIVLLAQKPQSQREGTYLADVLALMKLSVLQLTALPPQTQLCTATLSMLLTSCCTMSLFGIDTRSIPEQEVRCVSLFLIATIAQSFPQQTFQYWEQMLPPGDPTKRGARLPILTPMLHDSLRCRAAAAAAIAALLQKSFSQVQLASEQSTQKRHSFSPLATRMAEVLCSLHDAIGHGLRVLTPRDSSVRTVLVNTLSVVIVATPYRQCRSLIKKVLGIIHEEANSIEAMLRGEKPETNAALHCLGSLWRSKNLAESLTSFLNTVEIGHIVDAALQLLPSFEAWKHFAFLAKLHPIEIHKRWHAISASLASIFVPTQMRNDSYIAVHRGALVESLGLCIAFLGTPWQAFDAALQQDQQASKDTLPRATVEEQLDIHHKAVCRALQCSNGDVRALACTCCSHLNDRCLRSLSNADFEQMVATVLEVATGDSQSEVRADALSTIGIWSCAEEGTYPALAAKHHLFATQILIRCERETDDKCRQRIAVVVANLAAGLRVASSLNVPDALGLAKVAFSFSQGRRDPAVATHGYRTLAHIIASLPRDHVMDIINPAIDVMLNELREGRDMKAKWNAAHAIGECLQRADVLIVRPQTARSAVNNLLQTVEVDTSFKVRARAAEAVARVPKDIIGSQHPLCITVLADALRSTAESFKQASDLQVYHTQLAASLQSILAQYDLSSPDCPLEIKEAVASKAQRLAEEGILGPETLQFILQQTPEPVASS